MTRLRNPRSRYWRAFTCALKGDWFFEAFCQSCFAFSALLHPCLSIVVCYIFNLTTTKWRFHLVAGCIEHFCARAYCADGWRLLVLDYIFCRARTLRGELVAPTHVQGSFFLGKITIRPLLVSWRFSS